MNRPIERLKRTESPALRHALLRTRGSLHYAARGHVVRRRTVRRYLGSTDEPKLQLGAGPISLPGWLNSDLISADIYLDVSRKLALPDSAFAYVFAEHLIEHIPEGTAARMLAEIRRVLRPGGILRVTTPDLRKLIELYDDRNPVISRAEYARFLGAQVGRTYEQPARLLNDMLRLWGHRHIYDEEDLTAHLGEAGFVDVERVESGESRHPALRGLEHHGGAEWVNRAEAMTLEARAG